MAGADTAVAATLVALLKGDTLLVSLSDGRRLAEVGFVSGAEALLGALRRDLADCVARGAATDGDESALPWREFSRRLSDSVLPRPLLHALRAASPGLLSLQIDPALAWLAWELALSDVRLTGETLPVMRQIVGEDATQSPAAVSPRRGPLRVLVISGDSAESERATVQALVARLRSMENAAVSVVQARDIRRAELPALAAGDVVHYVGSTEPGDGPPPCWLDGEPLDIGVLASGATAASLVVVQATGQSTDASPAAAALRLATDVCRARTAALLCQTTVGKEAVEFMASFYGSLLRGAMLATAVRDARDAFHRSHGLAALALLRPELYGEGGLAPFGADRRPSAEDAVRQVTAMSVDLVDSTRLLGALGAERYSELLSEYHRRSAEILQGHGGVPDAPQGDDGGMCYFGLPVAREDAAVDALRAGFALIDAVQALGLSVRVGVCTGEVVVRDGQAVGSVVHLAARLQGIAAPGTMAVGESTRRIVRDRFGFQRLEILGRLKGFEQHEACYRALQTHQELSLGGSADAMPRLTPFVGRNSEFAELHEHWSAVRGGTLRLLRIVGDAGIGKSRLVREFKRELGARGHEVFECRCAPEHANSAFRPLIEALRAELRIVPSDQPAALGERLRRLDAGLDDTGDDALALLADLLGIQMPSRHPILDVAAERRRQLTVDLLVALARRRVSGAAGCLLVEDVHWMDPSSAEFLNRLVHAARGQPLLVLVTARSDAIPAWHPRAPVHEMELRGLSPDLSRALVLAACGEERLPSDVVSLIAARTDGVPLYIEESTRMAIEQRQTPGDASAPLAPQVPGTIVDLLNARLDRLGSAKQIAQAGAAIGREFPLPLLRAVLDHPGSPIAGHDLESRLGALQRSGMLLPRDDGAGTRFAFKHALMRDAAYRSLLARDRRRLHQVIATVIADQFADLGQRQPELLGFHHTEAGNDAEALRCWEAAARQSATRSAQLEAIGHVHSALDVLQRMPPGTPRDRQELRLQLLLAARLVATHGYGADRVERAYARALELARALGDGAALQRVLLGLEGFHFMRADFAQARVCVLEAAGYAGPADGGIQRIQTQWALANAQMHQGEMETAVAQMDECLDLYDRLEHRPDAVQDPGVMCLCYSGWSKWQLGFPDEALQRVTRVVQLAERLKHKFSLAEAYGFKAAVQHFRGENRDALESAERAIAICEDGGFAVWLGHARVMRGRALAELGEGAVGIEEMRQGYEQWAATGAVVTTPFYLAMRAEGLALCERHGDALALLRQALAIVERTGERYYEPEIRRLMGRLCWCAAGRDAAVADEAERWLRQALDGARSRGMRSLALRAAADLADLYSALGRPADALSVLQPAFDAITEGRGTRDLVDAERRLAMLRREPAL